MSSCFQLGAFLGLALVPKDHGHLVAIERSHLDSWMDSMIPKSSPSPAVRLTVHTWISAAWAAFSPSSKCGAKSAGTWHSSNLLSSIRSTPIPQATIYYGLLAEANVALITNAICTLNTEFLIAEKPTKIKNHCKADDSAKLGSTILRETSLASDPFPNQWLSTSEESALESISTWCMLPTGELVTGGSRFGGLLEHGKHIAWEGHLIQDRLHKENTHLGACRSYGNEPMETAHLEICSEANAHWYTGSPHTIRVSDNVAVNALGLMKCLLIWYDLKHRPMVFGHGQKWDMQICSWIQHPKSTVLPNASF